MKTLISNAWLVSVVTVGMFLIGSIWLGRPLACLVSAAIVIAAMIIAAIFSFLNLLRR